MSIAQKILILALDSVNLESIRPHLDGGRMPNLKHLMSGGVGGILQSTIPAHTAAAWTTLSTGKHPGVHGVMNFRRFDPRAQETRLNTTADVPHKTIWQLLDESGLRVGVVGQPQSYPARELKHGFAVTGFETPSTEAEFTWPKELKAEVLQRVPDFSFKSERIRDPGAGKDWTQWDDFTAGMDSLQAELENSHALNKYLATSRPWDVLFLYYQQTDPLFHKAWRWCDPETRDEDARRASRIDKFFARLDEMLGEILALPQSAGALVFGCSDHGHGPVHELVRVNGVLADLGFLKRGGMLTQASAAIKRVTGQRIQKGLGIAVDWKSTRAYMPFEAIAGFIYFNRTGREPQGIVGDNADSLAREMIDALSAQKSPHSGRALFDGIKPLADAYPQRGTFDFPDLFALPARGVNFVRKLSFGPSVEIPDENYKGTHRPEGFFVLSGAGVRSLGVPPMPPFGKERPLEASIADIAPTVLAALGHPVPADMTGRVLSDFFTNGLTASSSAASSQQAQGGADVYSDAEKALVEQRLADLGYVD
ncbi:MAG TPA: alkaline phosphatase family protein [Planctomycetota bacterium]|nr:alkaline phosphatase family protein [Planctomycetota bacterium]